MPNLASPFHIQRGFTLIELIFAVAIMATLCAVSLPALGNLMQTSQSRAAHNSMLSALTYRSDGSATGTNLTITFCDRRGPAHASTIVVNNGGRPRQGTPTAAQAAAACAGL